MTAQMTPGQTRVIDPILTEHARGYRQSELVGRFLFPFADVPAYGGKTIEFDKASFKVYNSKRAPGTSVKRIRSGYEGKPYAIVPSALEGVVPYELMQDASQVPGINLGTRAVNTVMRSLMLEHEVDSAALATDLDKYDDNHKVVLTGTDVWSDPASNPVRDIRTAREAIRSSIGVYPNTLVLSSAAMDNLEEHPALVRRSAATDIREVTDELLRRLFKVRNIHVGAAIVADDKDQFGDVWVNSAVLAYISPGADVNANFEEPAYGYTYRIQGMPNVVVPYQEQNIKSWVYGVSNDCTPLMTGMSAGFLIRGAGD